MTAPVALTSDKPQFAHDCDICVFLGGAVDVEGNPVDLYFCAGTGFPTVLFRYGNEGHQYTSGMAMVEHYPALAEAKSRAQMRGLLPNPGNVQTLECPKCGSVHDLPLCPEPTLTRDEASESFGFKPHPNPWIDEGSSVLSLHGLTHNEVCDVTGGSKADVGDRYIDIEGHAGKLSGYVSADSFEAICRVLGVQS